MNADTPTRIRATNLLRKLIADIEFHPLERKGAGRLKITGNISGLVSLSAAGQNAAVQVVAEEGFEPPTRGL